MTSPSLSMHERNQMDKVSMATCMKPVRLNTICQTAVLALHNANLFTKYVAWIRRLPEDVPWNEAILIRIEQPEAIPCHSDFLHCHCRSWPQIRCHLTPTANTTQISTYLHTYIHMYIYTYIHTYTADKGQWGRNVLQSVLIYSVMDLLNISSPMSNNVHGSCKLDSQFIAKWFQKQHEGGRSRSFIESINRSCVHNALEFEVLRVNKGRLYFH